jgi:ribosome-associated protein
MYDSHYDNQGEVSKSQRKRDMQALKRLGAELLDFSDDALRQLMLPEVLLDALRAARHISSNGARRRQMQYIGKLMQSIDAAPVIQAIEDKKSQHAIHTREFHLIETLRNQLLAGGDDALPAVMAEFPTADRQHLRKLVRKARKEQQTRQPPHSARLLFRYLRELQQEPDYL